MEAYIALTVGVISRASFSNLLVEFSEALDGKDGKYREQNLLFFEISLMIYTFGHTCVII